MKLGGIPKKRVVIVQMVDGTVTAIGQVRRRFLCIRYWSDYIEFDSPHEADRWVENPERLF